jgi:Protein of unknown function (DUF3035)
MIRLPSPSRLLMTALAGAVALGLGACADTRKAIGWDKVSPDEFRVVSRAPLTLPPDFGLRPPAPGQARPNESQPQDVARAALVGTQNAARPAPPADGSPGERTLVARLGTGVDAGIRDQIDRESAQLAEADRSFVDRLLFWQQRDPAQGQELDAQRESQRLREASATGRPAGEGSVAIVRRRQRGWLEGLF